ncbi:MAG: hypothetical protein ACRELB_19015, partial [Polyangiaceae bacterium]
ATLASEAKTSHRSMRGGRATATPMSPQAIDAPGNHWTFPWGDFGFLVSSPVSMAIGALLGALVIWQRKRLQLWAWRIRGWFR